MRDGWWWRGRERRQAEGVGDVGEGRGHGGGREWASSRPGGPIAHGPPRPCGGCGNPFPSHAWLSQHPRGPSQHIRGPQVSLGIFSDAPWAGEAVPGGRLASLQGHRTPSRVSADTLKILLAMCTVHRAARSQPSQWLAQYLGWLPAALCTILHFWAHSNSSRTSKVRATTHANSFRELCECSGPQTSDYRCPESSAK